MKWRPSRLENRYFKAVKLQADKIADGWLDIEVPECEDTGASAFAVKVPRIPFERWMRHTYMHRYDEWPNVCHIGLKMMNDDRNHSDWWIGSRLPIEFAYGRKTMEYRDFLDEDDPDYKVPPDDEEELLNKSKRLLDHCWHIRFESTKDRVRNSIFLVSAKKEIKGGRIMHVRSPADIPRFVEQCQSWNKSFNSMKMIAVVPNCSIEYNAVIRHAGAIITEIGSAAAHLVKIAREDNIPVIMCPNAFNEFFDYERISIYNKTIASTF